MGNRESNEIEPGRYDGDLFVELDYDPLGSKYPYRVEVWIWERSGKDGAWNWWASDGHFGNPPHQKHFRKLDAAVRHLHEMRAQADLGFLTRRIEKAVEARRVVLL